MQGKDIQREQDQRLLPNSYKVPRCRVYKRIVADLFTIPSYVARGASSAVNSLDITFRAMRVGYWSRDSHH